MTLPQILDKLTTTLRATRFNFTTESELQEGVATVLKIHGLPFVREHRLDKRNRLDFFLDRFFLDPAATAHGAGVAIETKIDGSLSALTRQIHRYAQFSQVEAIVVLSRRANAGNLPDTINGKPIHVVTLWSQGL